MNPERVAKKIGELEIGLIKAQQKIAELEAKLAEREERIADLESQIKISPVFVEKEI